jgi:hypothetical protein
MKETLSEDVLRQSCEELAAELYGDVARLGTDQSGKDFDATVTAGTGAVVPDFSRGMPRVELLCDASGRSSREALEKLREKLIAQRPALGDEERVLSDECRRSATRLFGTGAKVFLHVCGTGFRAIVHRGASTNQQAMDPECFGNSPRRALEDLRDKLTSLG